MMRLSTLMEPICRIADYADEARGFRCCGNMALPDRMAGTIRRGNDAMEKKGPNEIDYPNLCVGHGYCYSITVGCFGFAHGM